MDIQDSTAPLMRQIKSADRQARARATTWAEVESKLRSDIEESVLGQERLCKDIADLKLKASRWERVAMENESDAAAVREEMSLLNDEIDNLKEKIEVVEREKEEWVQVQQTADLDAENAKNHMMKNVVDTGERYRSQIDQLNEQLQHEKSKREELEASIKYQAASGSSISIVASQDVPHYNVPRNQKEKKKLRAAEGQADILQSTLHDLGGTSSDDDDELGSGYDLNESSAVNGLEANVTTGMGSYAAMEQLSQGFKAARAELKTLKEQLKSSEDDRNRLMGQLSGLQQMSEQMPLFEAKIEELSQQVSEKNFEIQGLREGMQEMRDMYRVQLDALLEEKAALSPVKERPSKSLEEMEREYQNQRAEDYTLRSDAAAFDLPFGG
jgi:chromosome segregation ATPase